ncbi:MAG: cytochrome c [Nitrospirae bacterium]|nr:cytochrome c [Nitrospirota bacterium]MBI3594218.1 cytochrome c [Nitrospirota bacterium]
MKATLFGLISFAFILLMACSSKENQAESPAAVGLKVIGETPSGLLKGETLFLSRCSGCHGEKGRGTERGPTFISPIYHPDHHGDDSFILAARNGARAHHWQFGDMPPIPGIREDDMKEIIAYIRWLQKENKVY